MFEISLPWPPSVNRIWRRSKFATYLSEVGKRYYAQTVPMIQSEYKDPQIIGRVKMTIYLYPPDKRKRDIDNCLKAILDAFTRAGIWRDDSQIDVLTVARANVVKNGSVRVRITY